jgi:hypothetical protein
MAQNLILIDALSSVGRKKGRKKKKRNSQGLFSPSAGHALLATPCEIFMAVRCN